MKLSEYIDLLRVIERQHGGDVEVCDGDSRIYCDAAPPRAGLKRTASAKAIYKKLSDVAEDEPRKYGDIVCLI